MAKSSNAKKYFITGTDTDAGKTSVLTSLLWGLRQKNYKTLAIKPVSSGCTKTENGLRNADVLMFEPEATVKLPYELLNPFAFEEPNAPHLISETLNTQEVYQACQPALNIAADYYFVEGVGGWHVPLNDQETTIDLAKAFNFPVILVIGLRLGCFNHTLLTVNSIRQSGLPLAGWIATQIDPHFPFADAYIASFQKFIPAPCFGVIPHLKPFSIEGASKVLSPLP